MASLLFRIASVVLLGLAVGCGPTRTAGTEGVDKAALAVLTIQQSNAAAGFEIKSVKFDDGPFYSVSGDHAFYLLPGDHELEIGLGMDLHGPGAWFTPFSDAQIPFPLSTGPLMAGRRYQLKPYQLGLDDPIDFFKHAAMDATNP